MPRLTKLGPQLSRIAPRIARTYLNGQRDEKQRDIDAPWRLWYRTPQWRALRLKVLRRDLYKCRLCRKVEGDLSQLVCDHIEPHRGNPALFWLETNLQTVCMACHDSFKQKQEKTLQFNRVGMWY